MKNLYFILFTLCVLLVACKGNQPESAVSDEAISQLEKNTSEPAPAETERAFEAEEMSAQTEEQVIEEIDETVEPIAEKTEKEAIAEKSKSARKRPAATTSKSVKTIIPKEKGLPTKAVQKAKPFDTDYLMGKFNPNKHPDFTGIASKYASNGGMRMRKDAYEAFKKMHAAAKADGISLKIISATRPFHHQKSIWEAKWNGKRKVDGKMLSKKMEPKQKALKILRWSSMPGTSRHHWGTDVDINNLNNSYFEKGQGEKVYNWLTANASSYGFCQVYSAKGSSRPDGYQEEKWHWSYLPVARELIQLYKQKLSNGDLGGFTGSESAELIDVKTKYVLGINPNCN